MTCLSCEERAKLLKQAKDALGRGDGDEVARLLKEVFGTVVGDISRLRDISIRTEEGRERYSITMEEKTE